MRGHERGRRGFAVGVSHENPFVCEYKTAVSGQYSEVIRS
jgi:hypothetical protein